jgi:hypothetical protein
MFVSLSGLAVLPAQAAFSSLYIFGDGACTTTDNTSPYANIYYYGNRWSNGRVWVEVLAQRQGLTYNANKNLSYLFHSSADLVGELSGFSATDATNSLFVVWVCDADLVDYMSNIYPTYGLNSATWNSAINSSLANHQTIIQTLYAKGARILIMPNAVDISEIPAYSGLDAGDKSTIRQGVIAFNTGLVTLANKARASLPGLTIYVPDYFTLLDNLVTHPGNYGFINATSDALDDGYYDLDDPTGAYYLFWDWLDPTAKAHEIMADIAQQLVSPVNISNLTLLTGSNQLDVANIPIGLNGFADGSTNLASGNWTSVTNFNSVSATQTIFVPTSIFVPASDPSEPRLPPPPPGGGGGTQTNSGPVFDPPQFYRLRFPFAWSWP